MGEWECIECGYIHEGDAPPKKCPTCGATSDKFEYYDFEDLDEDEEWDEDEEEEWDEEEEDWEDDEY